MRLTEATFLTVLIALFALGNACDPALGRGDDDDSSLADDDDSTPPDDDDSGPVGDDDSQPVGDDDTGDDDDDDSVNPGDDDTAGGQPPVLFEAGWSFGECGGLCFGDLQLMPGATIDYTLGSWEGTTSWSLSAALTSAGEAELVSLWAAVNYSALEPVYGCPDCADGGAQSMTWHEISVSFTTEYEYGNPPAPLVSLDQAVREIMDEAEDCIFSYWLLDPGNCVPR
jgi:hypothetical protein